MNDFLKNLRSAHKKDNSNSRRNLDGHYYPKEDRRQTFDRRSGPSENLDTLLISIQDVLPQIADNSTQILDIFKKLAHNNDLITQAKLKQANAVSQFFENMNAVFTNDLAPAAKQHTDKKRCVSKGYTVGDNYTKNDILHIIKSMRKAGSTFTLIAKFLTDKGIPTFSGKGKWHAQTIHRLCK